MSPRFMQRPAPRAGYWWVNVAPLGERPEWREQPKPPEPSALLFGYSEREFMRKQYR